MTRKELKNFIYECYREFLIRRNDILIMEDKDTDFSCGQYMKDNYGGGGHKGAAGGRLNLDQFNKLISECKI